MLKYYNSRSPANAKRKFPDAYEALLSYTHFLGDDACFRQREYHFTTNTQAFPKCKCCGMDVTLWKVRDRCYAAFCSNRCVHVDGSIHSKRKDTILHRYGVPHFSQHPLFNAKVQHTCLTKYGVSHHASARRNAGRHLTQIKQQHMSHSTVEALDDIHHLQLLNKQGKTLTEIASDLGVSLTPVRERFEKHNIVPVRHYSSAGEREVAQIVTSMLPHNTTVVGRDRQEVGQELDVWIPQYRIAVEYNGMYWHSDKRRSSSHLLDKTNTCASHDIKLLQVFESEWSSNQLATESALALSIGFFAYPQPQFGTVLKISSEEAEIFLKRHHLAGYCSDATVWYGAIMKGILVAVVTFTELGGEASMVQLCTDNSPSSAQHIPSIVRTAVVAHNWSTVHHTADRRWIVDHILKKMNFVDVEHHPPKPWIAATSGRVVRAAPAEGDLAPTDTVVWDCGATQMVLQSIV